MDHFEGITPEQRWKMDLLNEIRAIRQLLERNAQADKGDDEQMTIDVPIPAQRKTRKA